MNFTYNSWKLEYKTPFGAVKRGVSVHFYVRTDAQQVFIHGFGDKIEMQETDGGFSADVMPRTDCGIIFYTFEATENGVSHIFGKSAGGGKAAEGGEPYQLTVHKNKDTPEWFKNKVMYQIYVDRFFKGDTNETKLRKKALMHTDWSDKPVYVKNDKGEIVVWDFFGGNLDGVIQKLDYLSGLGVDVIYLNPIFESHSNHKYDTADYSKTDMMYGTEDTLKRLVDEAGKRGMKIMLDGVFSHTGDDSVYFNKYKTYGEGGAYNDKNSKYFEWYRFEQYPDKYDCWWGVKALPAVNELAPSYIDFLLDENNGAVIKWMRTGVAGWRLDVADELPDEFIKKLKQAIEKVNPEAVLLGEVWEDASNKVSYGKRRGYILVDSMYSVSNYPLRDALIALLKGEESAKDFGKKIMLLQENYPKDVFLSLMNMTGTHDTVRLMTILGDAPDPDELNTWQQRDYSLPEDKKATAYERIKLYFAAIFTLPGNPCIYYGDEIGLEGYADPYNRGTFDWDKDNKDMESFIKKLAAVREDIISDDVFVGFENEGDMLTYKLESCDKTYKVVINHTEKSASLDIDGYEPNFMYNAKIEQNKAELSPRSFAVLKNI